MNDEFADRVRDVLSDPQNLPQQFKDWLVEHASLNALPAQTVRAPAFLSTGLQGSNTSSRFVGATASGHPTTGYYLIGDYCVDQTGAFWVCTISGSPGTWIKVGSGGVSPAFVGARIQATSTQSIPNSTNTDLHYQQVYFDTDSMANLGANDRILTVNTAGTYLVVCETVWAWTSGSAGRRINVVVQNGYYSSGTIPTQFQSSDTRMAIWQTDGSGGPTPYTTNTSVGVFRAAKGDFFSSGAYQVSGASQTVNGLTNCFMSAVLVGT